MYIPLPNHLHAEWTIAAARAGKHVLCEKPLATTTADAERMIQACEAEGVLLMEAFMYRLHPTWEAGAGAVVSGRIGELRAVQSWFSYFNDDPNDIRNTSGGRRPVRHRLLLGEPVSMLFGAEPERIQGSVTRDPGWASTPWRRGSWGSATAWPPSRARSAEPDQRVHIYGTRAGSRWRSLNIPPDLLMGVRHRRRRSCPARDPGLTFDPADEYAIQAERFAAVLDGTLMPIPPRTPSATSG